MYKQLEPSALNHHVDPTLFPFETTAELDSRQRPLGQTRAVDALEFGLTIDSDGYNVFVCGPAGAGKRTTTTVLLEQAAAKRSVAADLVYVYNFEEPERPRALKLPAGLGTELSNDLETLIERLGEELPRALAGTLSEQQEPPEVLDLLARTLDPLTGKYTSHPPVLDHLRQISRDILEHLHEFTAERKGLPALPPPFPLMAPDQPLQRYRANLLVDRNGEVGAPVVFEPNPTHHNLVGRVEHHVQLGGFVTDFTMIRPGAFHRADGGYLVLDARDVLTRPLAYDALKRMLQDREVRIEETGDPSHLVSMATLKPQPVPVRVKVVLLGTPWMYYVLQHIDEDFLKLFKVKGEFADDMEFNDENCLAYAFLTAARCRAEGLLPFHRDAVAQLVEHGLRVAEHQRRLATHFLELSDLVRESHYWAGKEGAALVEAAHVRQALALRTRRNNLLEEELGRQIEDGTILIEVTGKAVGQVNALSVYDLGDYAFGKPTRLTAKVFLGKEGLVNIERESDLGGRIHNKGVLILTGYFGAKYAMKFPISFAATLCFEQSYGGVEGDSASSAELFALISALGDVPLRQDLAVTGSIDQMGNIQAVGGINLKIEGFFKTCQVRGLTGSQGVIIPQANVPNLMLDEGVIAAVREGRFHIYAIRNVDEGLELLAGMPAGKDDGYGAYPADTVNAKVFRRLERLMAQWRRLHGEE